MHLRRNLETITCKESEAKEILVFFQLDLIDYTLFLRNCIHSCVFNCLGNLLEEPKRNEVTSRERRKKSYEILIPEVTITTSIEA